MKNFQELLVDIDESVLDDDLLDQYSPSNLTDKLKDVLLFKYPKEISGCDAYGRTLEVGDWVICVPPGKKSSACQIFGIVSKLSAKRVTVQIRSDENFVSTGMGSQYYASLKRKKEIMKTPLMTVSVPTSMVFKITNKEEFLTTIH